MKLLRQWLAAIFWVLAALVVLFEEWLWDPLRRVMAALTRLPLLRGLSGAIARLPARWAAVVFLFPVAALFPFKMLGLWLIARGQVAFGLIVFVGAKVVGTALFAWLFGLTRPALMSLPWFATVYVWVVGVRDRVHAWIRRQRLYRMARWRLRRWRKALKRRLAEIFARNH